MDKICGMVEEEIRKIEGRGITTNNIEMLDKLVDIYKDLKTVEGMEGYNYSQARYSRDGYSMNDYDRGNSYGRHYVRGHYSMDGEDRRTMIEKAMRDSGMPDSEIKRNLDMMNI